MTAATLRSATGSRAWLKRLGYAGFAFFLLKGLTWLAGGLIFYWLL